LEQNKNSFFAVREDFLRRTLMPVSPVKLGTVKVHPLNKMKIIHGLQIAGISLNERAHWAQNENLPARFSSGIQPRPTPYFPAIRRQVCHPFSGFTFHAPRCFSFVRLTFSREIRLCFCKLCKNERHHWRHSLISAKRLCSCYEQSEINFSTLIPGGIQPPLAPSFPATHRQNDLHFAAGIHDYGKFRFGG
jgi:hypothetical protein